jgi:methionyl-tRNA formyltransferase
MRIVFIGTVEFSFKALEKLINIDSNVVGVCTKKNHILIMILKI